MNSRGLARREVARKTQRRFYTAFLRVSLALFMTLSLLPGAWGTTERAYADEPALIFDGTFVDGTLAIELYKPGNIVWAIEGIMGNGWSLRLNTVKKLIVTGVVDFHDFNVIDGNLHSVEELDMSGAAMVGGGSPSIRLTALKQLKSIILPKEGEPYVVGASFFGATPNLETADVSNLLNIPSGMFAGCSSLKSVALPTEAYTLSPRAFSGCSSLTSIDLSHAISSGVATLPTIANYAFSGCSSLTSATMPAAKEGYSIGIESFLNNSSLSSIDLNNAVAIDRAAFAGCAALKALDISKATKLGDSAFKGSGMQALLLPSTPPAVAEGSTQWNPQAQDPDGSFAGLLQQDAGTLFLVSDKAAWEALDDSTTTNTLIKQYIVPKLVVPVITGDTELTGGQTLSLTATPATAQEGLYQWHKDGEAIEGATAAVYEKVAEASDRGTYSFSLAGLELPTSAAIVKIDGRAPFDGVLTVENNSAGSLEARINALLATYGYDTSSGDTTVNGYADVKELTVTGELNANLDCERLIRRKLTNLTKLDLGDTALVEGAPGEISRYFKFSDAIEEGNQLTYGLTQLKSVILPKNGDRYTPAANTFRNLGNLEFADVSHVSSLSGFMFSNCIALQQVVLPSERFGIGDRAFGGNSSLKTIDISNATSIGSSAFVSNSALLSITMPSAQGYSIGAFAFADSAITAIDLTNATSIGSSAFFRCANLVSSTLTMPANDFTLGARAFGSTLIESIDLSKMTGDLGAETFENCYQLKTITMPQSPYALGKEVFNGCTSLKTVDLSKATEIGAEETSSLVVDLGVLAGTQVTEIDLSSATLIKSDAFMKLGRLTTVKLPTDHGYTIGDSAFEGTTSLKVLDLSKATALGDSAFFDSGIKTLLVPLSPPEVVLGFSQWNPNDSASDGSFAGLLAEDAGVQFLIHDKSAYEALDDSTLANSVIKQYLLPKLVVPTIEGNLEPIIGQTLSLTATPATAEAGSYQWYKDGVALEGATAAVYEKTAEASDAGSYSFTIAGLELPTTAAELKVGETPLEPSEAQLVSYNAYTTRQPFPEGDPRAEGGEWDLMLIAEFTFDRELSLKDANAIFDEIPMSFGYDYWYPANASLNARRIREASVIEGHTLRLVYHDFGAATRGALQMKAQAADKTLPSLSDAEGKLIVFPDVSATVGTGGLLSVVSRQAGTTTSPATTVVEAHSPEDITRGMIFGLLLRNGQRIIPNGGVGVEPASDITQTSNMKTVIHNFSYYNMTDEILANSLAGLMNSYAEPATDYSYPGYTTTTEGNRITITSKRNTKDEVLDYYVVDYPRDRDTQADKSGIAALITQAALAPASDYTAENYAVLTNELAVAKALNSGIYYLQSEIDDQAARLRTALENTLEDPPVGSGVEVVGYKAQTAHGEVSSEWGAPTADQWLEFDITFDKNITLESAAEFFSDTDIWLGGNNVSTDARNRAEVSPDGKTLHLYLFHQALYTGRLKITAKDTTGLVPSLTSADGAVSLPAISMIVSGFVKDGSEIVTTAQTVGSDNEPASVTKRFTYPEMATQGQVHFVVLKNGAPVAGIGGIGSDGFTPTTTGHNFTPHADSPYEAWSLQSNGFGEGISLSTSIDGKVMDLTLASNTAVLGEVLDVVVVGYPREPGTLAHNPAGKAELERAIEEALAALTGNYTEANYAALQDELAKAKAVAASSWYLQAEIDAETEALKAALANTGGATDPSDPYDADTARVVSYKAWTEHKPNTTPRIEDTDDQYMIIQVEYDKGIHIMGGDPLDEFDAHYGPAWINVGAGGAAQAQLAQQGHTQAAGFAEGLFEEVDKNSVRVLEDGKTLEFALHIPARATDNKLIARAIDEGKYLHHVMSNSPMKSVAFPDLSMIVSVLYKDGSEVTTTSQMIGTESSAAEATIEINKPDSATRGMVHFLVMKDGVPVKAPDANGGNVTIHNHDYLSMTSEGLAELAAGVANNLPGIHATVTGKVITLSSESNEPGEVLDMVLIHYPRDRAQTPYTTELNRAIRSAEAAVEADFSAPEWAAVQQELMRARSYYASQYYLQAEIDAETAKLLAVLDGRGGDPGEDSGDPEFIGQAGHYLFAMNPESGLHKDVSVRIALNGNELTGVVLGNNDLGEGWDAPRTLIAGSDYTVSGDSYTIKKEILATLPMPPEEGLAVPVTFTFTDAPSLSFIIDVVSAASSYDASGIKSIEQDTDEDGKVIYEYGKVILTPEMLTLAVGEGGAQAAATVRAGSKVRIPVSASPSSIDIAQECDMCAGYIVNNGVSSCSTDGSCPDAYGFCSCEGAAGTNRGVTVEPTVRFVHDKHNSEIGLPNGNVATAALVTEGDQVYLEVSGLAAGETMLSLESFIAHPNTKKENGVTVIPDGSGDPICVWYTWMSERSSEPFEIAVTVEGEDSGTDPTSGPSSDPVWNSANIFQDVAYQKVYTKDLAVVYGANTTVNLTVGTSTTLELAANPSTHLSYEGCGCYGIINDPQSPVECGVEVGCATGASLGFCECEGPAATLPVTLQIETTKGKSVGSPHAAVASAALDVATGKLTVTGVGAGTTTVAVEAMFHNTPLDRFFTGEYADDAYVAYRYSLPLTITVVVEGEGDEAARIAAAKELLRADLNVANTVHTAQVSADGTDIEPTVRWVTSAVDTVYAAAIAAAQVVYDNSQATLKQVEDARLDIAFAEAVYVNAQRFGTKQVPGDTVPAKMAGEIRLATGHSGTVINGTDDQYVLAEVDFDKPIYLKDGAALAASIDAWLGQANSTLTASASDFSVVDSKTLRMRLHFAYAGYSGLLHLAPKGTVAGLTTTDANGVAVAFPIIDTIFVPNGVKLEGDIATAGTTDTAASVTKTVVAPKSATRGMVHLKFSVNGQMLGSSAGVLPDSNFTTHYHNYLALDAVAFAKLIADSFNGAATEGSENGGAPGNFLGYRAVANGDGTVTITANQATEGELLNLEVVAYPSSAIPDDTTTGPGGPGSGPGQGGYTRPTLIAAPGEYTGSGTVTWRTDAPLDEFIELRFGSTALARTYYTVSSDPTAITFTEAFAQSLEPGTYSYLAVFKGGSVALPLNVVTPVDNGSGNGSGGGDNTTTNNTTNNYTTNNYTTNSTTAGSTYSTPAPQADTGTDATADEADTTDTAPGVLSAPSAESTTVPSEDRATSSIDDAETPLASAANTTDSGLQMLVYLLFLALALLLGVCGLFCGMFLASRRKFAVSTPSENKVATP